MIDQCSTCGSFPVGGLDGARRGACCDAIQTPAPAPGRVRRRSLFVIFCLIIGLAYGAAANMEICLAC